MRHPTKVGRWLPNILSVTSPICHVTLPSIQLIFQYFIPILSFILMLHLPSPSNCLYSLPVFLPTSTSTFLLRLLSHFFRVSKPHQHFSQSSPKYFTFIYHHFPVLSIILALNQLCFPNISSTLLPQALVSSIIISLRPQHFFFRHNQFSLFASLQWHTSRSFTKSDDDLCIKYSLCSHMFKRQHLNNSLLYLLQRLLHGLFHCHPFVQISHLYLNLVEILFLFPFLSFLSLSFCYSSFTPLFAFSTSLSLSLSLSFSLTLFIHT